MEPVPHTRANVAEIAKIIDKNGKMSHLETAQGKAMGAVGAEYKRIEKDYHGNIAAVKKIRQLAAGKVDVCYDYMRTFIPLAREMGLLPDDDLVDRSEGENKVSSALDAKKSSTKAGKKAPAEAGVGDTPAKKSVDEFYDAKKDADVPADATVN